MLSTINKMWPYAVFVYQSEAVSDTLHSVWQFWSQPFVQYNNLILTVKTDTNSACIALLSCGFNKRSHSCCVPKNVLCWFPAGLRNLSIAAANGKNGFFSNLGLDFYTTGLGVQFRFCCLCQMEFSSVCLHIFFKSEPFWYLQFHLLTLLTLETTHMCMWHVWLPTQERKSTGGGQQKETTFARNSGSIQLQARSSIPSVRAADWQLLIAAFQSIFRGAQNHIYVELFLVQIVLGTSLAWAQ